MNMMQSCHAEDFPFIAIAQARNFSLGPEKFASRHSPLVTALAERNIAAVALNGAKDHVGVQSFSKYYQFGQETIRAVTANVRIDAAYDLSGGIARFVPEVAALNQQGIRDIVKSKATQYEALQGELGEYLAQTEIVPAEKQRLLNAIDAIVSERVHLKVNGVDSKKYPMLQGEKADVARRLDQYLNRVPPSETVLVQEYLPEVASAFHHEFRFADEAERSIAKDRSDLHRELRVHVIDESAVLTNGRTGLDSEQASPRDEWVHFTPESIPRHVTDLATAAAQLLRIATGDNDSYLAVDMTPDGTKIIEINGRNIGTMRPSNERPGAQKSHETITNALADKLTNMAQRKV